MDAENQGGSIDDQEEFFSSREDMVKNWLEAIEIASSDEKDWRKDTKDAITVYEAGENAPGTAFNIYHANINTIVPAIFNTPPIPDVRPRWGDTNPELKNASRIIERVISQSIDDDDFVDTISSAVFDLAVSSRGVARVTYEPVMEGDKVVYQECGEEYVYWSDFRHGPCRKWKDCPWVAFRKFLSKDEIAKAASKTIADKLSYDHRSDVQDDDDGGEKDDLKDIYKRALIWEIWDKDTGKVYWISPSYDKEPVWDEQDPLGLKGFFPCPRPMYAGKTNKNLTPISDFKVYRGLIEEVDRLTRRITALLNQCRARGMVAKFPGQNDLQRISQADDGELIEVSDANVLLQGGGLEKLISWFPLEPIIKTIQILYQQREVAKQNIYEVTGISDIVRGQSNPNETLGAQKIKSEWGGLRLQTRQAEVARFCRDLIRMKAEIVGEHYTDEMLAVISGLPIQNAKAILSSDAMRTWLIDIETDSTVMADLSYKQENMSKFVQGAGVYFQSLAGPMEAGLIDPGDVTAMFVSFCRSFKLGREAEDALERMLQKAQQNVPDPQKVQQQIAQQKEQAEQEIQQMQEQAKQQIEVEKKDAAADLKLEKTQELLTRVEHRAAMEAENNRIDVEETRVDHEREKLEFDKEMAAADAEWKRYMEENKAFKDGVEGKPNKGAAAPLDEFRQILSALTEATQQLMASSQATNASLDEVKEYIAAPALIERDSQGRVIGAVKQIEKPTIQ